MALVKLKVELNGLDNITNNTLSFFLKSNLCNSAGLNNTSVKPDVYILDNERGLKPELIESLVDNNQFAIVLHMSANKPDKLDNIYCVSKPIRVLNLTNTLKVIQKELTKANKNTPNKIATEFNKDAEPRAELYQNAVVDKEHISKKLSQIKTTKRKASSNNVHLGMAVKNDTDQSKVNRYKAHKHVGSNKDIDPKNKEQLKKIYHSPEKYLYHYLIEAVNQAKSDNSDVKIKTILGDIYFENKTQLFHYHYDETKLRYAEKTPLFIDSVCTLVEIQPELLKIKNQSQEAQIMIWNSAITASTGRIPMGTSINDAVILTCWPNFTKLMIFRYAVQITSAWSRNNLSLMDTANQLQIPQRYVFTLYNAMHAIGCVKISRLTKADSKIERKNKSVFSKILSHIFNK